MEWKPEAAGLAAAISHQQSRWRPIIAAIPRHVFVPCWWVWSAPGSGFGTDVWTLHDGPTDPTSWRRAAYGDRSLVTQIGPDHADHAKPGDRRSGRPTSSATLPSLIVQMLQHARLYDGADVLEVGTGSGYGCAALAARLDDTHVTSIDVDPYLTAAAAERLGGIGRHPHLVAGDATGPRLPSQYDRIISTVAVRPIPPSWLAALKPGGRLVTTLIGTALIVTADKTPDGGAAGRIEWDRAGFMPTRSTADYPPLSQSLLATVREADGEQVRTGRYPVLEVTQAWELWSMLSLTAPGIEHHYEETDDGRRTAMMIHPDGSWARATDAGGDAPQVHQGGPRRLWDLLDDIRQRWLRDGSLPLYGARVTITPDGVCHLNRGRWSVTVR